MSDPAPVEYLTVANLLQICRRESLQEVRDPGLLASAAARPRASVFGEDAYPSLYDKAAALMQSLARNHALVDGNKRLAWLATITFLRLNGTIIDMRDDDAVELVLSVVAGERDVPQLASVLRAATRS